MDHAPELTLDRDALNPPLDTAAKRGRIEAELRKDASRSDREIARIIGCDHKTIAAHRGKLLPTASPSVSPRACPPPPGVVDEPKYDPFDPKEGDIVVPHQPAIAVYENTTGAVVIIQVASSYDNEDPIIMVRPENLAALIVSLRKFLP
jgi:hypothetical protein